MFQLFTCSVTITGMSRISDTFNYKINKIASFFQANTILSATCKILAESKMVGTNFS